MTPFQLHWWRAQHGRGNLGDEISPKVFSHVTGREVVRAEIADCDGIAIGSIFNPRQASRRKRNHAQLVWGSGTLKPRSCDYADLWVDLAALRGPKTAGQIANCPDIPFGDPGLFVQEIWPASGPRHNNIGLIPHHSLLKSPKVALLQKAIGECVVLDFTDPDEAATLQTLSGCDLIVSSSLHGLIFADAYGIPSLFWNELGADNEWKFEDYFLGVTRADYASLNAAQILTVIESGKVEDLPFSVLSDQRCAEVIRDLRQAVSPLRNSDP